MRSTASGVRSSCPASETRARWRPRLRCSRSSSSFRVVGEGGQLVAGVRARAAAPRRAARSARRRRGASGRPGAGPPRPSSQVPAATTRIRTGPATSRPAGDLVDGLVVATPARRRRWRASVPSGATTGTAASRYFVRRCAANRGRIAAARRGRPGRAEGRSAGAATAGGGDAAALRRPVRVEGVRAARCAAARVPGAAAPPGPDACRRASTVASVSARVARSPSRFARSPAVSTNRNSPGTGDDEQRGRQRVGGGQACPEATRQRQPAATPAGSRPSPTGPRLDAARRGDACDGVRTRTGAPVGTRSR